MKTKYPRTFCLHYSENQGTDDKQHKSDNHFSNENVVVSIKMDGENTSIYSNNSHARSLNSNIDSEDRRWIEAFRISKIEGKIPENVRLCGENLFYKHTCYYENLESMFYCFSIWNDNNCLSWNDTKILCNKLDIKLVPIIYEGIYDKELILQKFSEYVANNGDVEGFVIRNVDSFDIEDFSINVSKYIRKTFVIPSAHWKYSKKTQNVLLSKNNPWNEI